MIWAHHLKFLTFSFLSYKIRIQTKTISEVSLLSVIFIHSEQMVLNYFPVRMYQGRFLCHLYLFNKFIARLTWKTDFTVMVFPFLLIGKWYILACEVARLLQLTHLYSLLWVLLFLSSGGGGLVPKSCPTLATHGLQPARLLYPWNSPGKNTGVGCHFLLQGIFPTQELNPGFLHCKADSLLTELWGKPFLSSQFAVYKKWQARQKERKEHWPPNSTIKTSY